MIVWPIIVAVLLALKQWATPFVHSHFNKAYATAFDQTVVIALWVAIALLFDVFFRRLYWHGYLRRRRGVDTPALIQDIVTILLVIITLSVGLTVYAGLSVAGIVTASGATAVVLGIALQAVIQDLFSGLAINFEGSYGIGDWLTVYTDQIPEPIFGRVTHISWRSTNLSLPDGSRIIVPNHLVTANPVTNHSQPREPKRISVELSLDNRGPIMRASNAILGEALRTARRAAGLSRVPEPSVLVKRAGADATVYEIRYFYHPDEIEPDNARATMLAAVLDIVQKVKLPTPSTMVELTKEPDLDFTFGAEEQRALVSRAPLFEAALDHDQVDILVGNSHEIVLPVGAQLMKQGDPGVSMFVIAQGAASVTIRDSSGQSHEVNILAAGDVVGEMSLLTGEPRTASVTALTPLRVLEIPQKAIGAVLQNSPDVAERFSKVLAERMAQNAALTNSIQRDQVQRDILGSILRIFRKK